MPLCTEKKAYGVLFCRTGRERAIANELKKRFQEIDTMVPIKKRYWRHGGEAIEEWVVLFPGYVFFRVHQDYDAFTLTKPNDVYLLLKSGECDWRLRGDDECLAERLFQTDGMIDFSKAYFEGDKIRIAQGYLKSYEGQIIRVNRRAKTAQIRIYLHEKGILLWLGYEEIEQIVSADEMGGETNA